RTFCPVRRGTAFGETITGICNDIRLSILVICHLSLKHVRYGRAIHVIVQPQHASRLQRDLPHSQRTALCRIQFVAEIDGAQQLLALTGILRRDLSLARGITDEKCKNDDDSYNTHSHIKTLPPEIFRIPRRPSGIVAPCDCFERSYTYEV